jgi:SAM-dependent methyltransferase
MPCRVCGGAVEPAVDLGDQPASSRFPSPADPPEPLLPLRLGVCGQCGLVQLADASTTQVDEPGSPSPLASPTMAAHARSFAAELVDRGLASPTSRVLSLASHGGHLAPFLHELGVPVTVADLPQIPDGPPGTFDLVIDNYLLAHLDQPRSALRRMAELLAPAGTLALEFDDLAATVEGGQWDAIGLGHPVYPTLTWLTRELEMVGLSVGEASRQTVFGGAMRAYARAEAVPGPTVARLLDRDATGRLDRVEGLAPLAAAIERAREEVIAHLRSITTAGGRVAGYGAPARAITFLNAMGIDSHLLAYTVDRAPAKHGRVIPGVGLPIMPVETLLADRPDAVLVLTWNLVDEVRSTLDPVIQRGARLLVAIPRLLDVTEPAIGPAPDPDPAGGAHAMMPT